MSKGKQKRFIDSLSDGQFKQYLKVARSPQMLEKWYLTGCPEEVKCPEKKD